MNHSVSDLINKHPLLFKKLKHIECEEGWLPLLYQLCSLIEAEIYRIPEEIVEGIYVEQIKEKFGGLRFYMMEDTPYIKGAIALAERMSYHICEVCGAPGSRRDGPWIKVLCDKDYEDFTKVAAERHI